MRTQGRGFPLLAAVLLVAAAGALVIAAALATAWLLLGLVPLAVMLACAAMMTAGRMPCVSRARAAKPSPSASTVVGSSVEAS